MIDGLITIILVEIIIVLGIYIISWVTNMLFYEEPEPNLIYSGELSDEQAELIKKAFEDKKDD